MVSNIVVLGINRDMTRQVAEILSEQLEMHFLDTIELFEFDNIPRSFSDILKTQGERYFREKEKSLTGYVSSFDNTVIHAESGSVIKSKNIKKFKEHCLIIYIHYPASMIKKILGEKKYDTVELKKFFNISIDRVQRRIGLLKKQSDIVVTGSGKSSLKITSEILRSIDNYYLK